MWTIYALVDPRTNQIRYVGQTQNHPEVRLVGHLLKDDGNKRKRAWIDELRRLGEKPIVVVLEYASSFDEALEVESSWIRRGHRSEWPLLNSNANNYAERKYTQRYAQKITKPVVPVTPVELPVDAATPRRVEMSTKWREVVHYWFEKHPEALTGKVNGIGDLARHMAAADGRPGDWQNYKSSAHRMFHDYRAMKLGTDITGGA